MIIPRKVFISGKIPENGIVLLRRKGYQLKIQASDRALSREQFLRQVRGSQAILSLLTDRIDAEVFDAAGRELRIVANYAVGYDNIDLAAARKRGIHVTNTPDVLNSSVAEHAIALMLAIAHRLVEADGFTRAGKYTGWKPLLLLGTCLHNKTLGIIGLGRIGYEVARRMKDGFDMKLLYHDAFRNKKLEQELGIRYVPLAALLRQSDFVSLHVPLLPATRHMIAAPQLRSMKKTAYLINTSRGPVVDEKALLQALQKRIIAGAALDVFEHEPQLTPGLLRLANVILTPHIASATKEAREGMSALAARNIIAVLSGKKPLTPLT